MSDNYLPTDSETKIDNLLKEVENLILKRDFDEAISIVEESRNHTKKFATVKQQLLLNKYQTIILFELTRSAYEIEKDAHKFLSLFEKNQDFFELHLDKSKYNRLLKYRSNIRKKLRRKKLNIIATVVFLLFAVLIYRLVNAESFPKISFGNFFSSMAEHSTSDEPDDNIVTDSGSDTSNDSSNMVVTSDTAFDLTYEPVLDTEPQNSPVLTDTIVDGDYLLPSDSKVLTTEDIVGMTSKDLRLAINEMYARHGYYFGAGANQRYFDEKSWYNPNMDIKSPDDIIAKFTEIENKNLSFLAAQERRLKNNN